MYLGLSKEWEQHPSILVQQSLSQHPSAVGPPGYKVVLKNQKSVTINHSKIKVMFTNSTIANGGSTFHIHEYPSISQILELLNVVVL